MIIDDKTKALYEAMKEEITKGDSFPWPSMLCEMAIEVGVYDGTKRNYREWISAYEGSNYGEWYRCLAFITFGYGNYSNNDRRRNGLPARRKTRR